MISAVKPAQSQRICNRQQQDKIKLAVQEIYRKLAAIDVASLPLSLAGGSAGICLFWQQAQQQVDLPGDDLVMAYLNDMFNRIAQSHFTESLFSGLSGIGWLTDHFAMNSTLFDHNTAIDEVLQALVQTKQWQGEYELVNGLVGLGVYALQRAQLGFDKQLLCDVLNHLDALSLSDVNGITWPTPNASRYHFASGQGHEFNLGLAHGMVSVVAFYCAVLAKQPQYKAQIMPNLLGGARWLMAQAGRRGASRFGRHQHCQQQSRVGWCYGDLSIALTLLRTGYLTEQQDITAFAFDLAEHCVARDKASYGVQDAGLCHGSAGLLLIYQQLYHLSGEASFVQQARFWLDDTLKRAQTPGGLFAYNGMTGESIDAPGLLEGSAGVGLALIAATTDQCPAWADILLLR